MWMGLGILVGLLVFIYIAYQSCTLCGWRWANHDGYVCRRCYVEHRYQEKQ